MIKINIPNSRLNLTKLTATQAAITSTQQQTIVQMNPTTTSSSGMNNNNKITISSTVKKLNITLHGQTKACGLFDTNFDESLATEESTTTNTNTNKPDEMALIVDNCFSSYDETENNSVINTPISANSNTIDFFPDENANKFVYTELNNSEDQLSFYNNNILPDDFDLMEKEVDLTEVISNSSIDNTITKPVKTSKFLDKVNEQNLKIKMPETVKFEQQLSFLQTELDLQLTPGTYTTLFDSIPTPVLPTNLSLNIENTDLLLLTPQFVGQPNVNPFFNTLTINNNVSNFDNATNNNNNKALVDSEFETNDDAKSPSLAAESVSLDHDYVPSPKKRKASTSFSFDESDSSLQSSIDITSTSALQTSTTTTMDTPTTSTSNGKRKKQRTKGIYRAKDVRSDIDLQNYLERRRKNNISSKQSRLSKKKLYNDMDDKSRQLELDNERLKNTITHLESLTKLMKDMLLKKITSNNQ